MPSVTFNETITVSLHYCCCIECGSEDVSFADPIAHRVGGVSYKIAACNFCCSTISTVLEDPEKGFTKREAVDLWNLYNDWDALMQSATLKADAANSEIARLHVKRMDWSNSRALAAKFKAFEPVSGRPGIDC